MCLARRSGWSFHCWFLDFCSWRRRDLGDNLARASFVPVELRLFNQIIAMFGQTFFLWQSAEALQVSGIKSTLESADTQLGSTRELLKKTEDRVKVMPRFASPESCK